MLLLERALQLQVPAARHSPPHLHVHLCPSHLSLAHGAQRRVSHHTRVVSPPLTDAPRFRGTFWKMARIGEHSLPRQRALARRSTVLGRRTLIAIRRARMHRHGHSGLITLHHLMSRLVATPCSDPCNMFDVLLFGCFLDSSGALIHAQAGTNSSIGRKCECRTASVVLHHVRGHRS